MRSANDFSVLSPGKSLCRSAVRVAYLSGRTPAMQTCTRSEGGDTVHQHYDTHTHTHCDTLYYSKSYACIVQCSPM